MITKYSNYHLKQKTNIFVLNYHFFVFSISLLIIIDKFIYLYCNFVYFFSPKQNVSSQCWRRLELKKYCVFAHFFTIIIQNAN